METDSTKRAVDFCIGGIISEARRECPRGIVMAIASRRLKTEYSISWVTFMNGKISRRSLMQTAGVAAFAASPGDAATMPAPRFEGKDTPKIALAIGDGGSAQSDPVDPLRRIRQLGVEWVLSGGPPIPWDEARLKEQMDRIKAAGLNLGNLMITGFNNAIYGRPGRDEEIEKVIASVQAAGKVGLPVVEYNWYAHRATEGYFDEIDDVRTGVGWTSFDYELARGPGHQYMGTVREGEASVKFRDLPALPNEGAHSLKEMWETIT